MEVCGANCIAQFPQFALDQVLQQLDREIAMVPFKTSADWNEMLSFSNRLRQ